MSVLATESQLDALEDAWFEKHPGEDFDRDHFAKLDRAEISRVIRREIRPSKEQRQMFADLLAQVKALDPSFVMVMLGSGRAVQRQTDTLRRQIRILSASTTLDAALNDQAAQKAEEQAPLDDTDPDY